jgi:hypothetical protein
MWFLWCLVSSFVRATILVAFVLFFLVSVTGCGADAAALFPRLEVFS